MLTLKRKATNDRRVPRKDSCFRVYAMRGVTFSGCFRFPFWSQRNEVLIRSLENAGSRSRVDSCELLLRSTSSPRMIRENEVTVFFFSPSFLFFIYFYFSFFFIFLIEIMILRFLMKYTYLHTYAAFLY